MQESLALRDHLLPTGPSAETVREQLDRILSNPAFDASAKRRSFLRYVVEETLAGRGDRLKGYSIAVEVFGRDQTFDAQTDPVVRLEARRLRRDLDSYYVAAGSHDAVRISIPKGSYVPHFEPHDLPGEHLPQQEVLPDAHTPQDTPATDSRPWAGIGRVRTIVVGIVGVVIMIAMFAGWYALGERSGKPPVGAGGNRPTVVVLPFEAIKSTEYSTYLARGIGEELVGDLMRFPSMRVYTTLADAVGSDSSDPLKKARELGAAYAVTGAVRDDPAIVRVSAKIVETATGRIVWTGAYDRPTEATELIKTQRELASEIATALGQPYGIVNSDLVLRMTTPAVSNLQSYVCVLRAYGFRQRFERDKYASVVSCLDEAVRRDPGYSDAWAMLGWLHMDAGRLGYSGGANRPEEYRIALNATSKAVELEPTNILALKALAATNHYIGRYDESERLARRALELNPYDPETMAQLGWRLAVRGKFDEGLPILQQAIDRSLNPPGWYYHLILIDMYMNGKYEKMYVLAQRPEQAQQGYGQFLIAVAAGALGKRDAARAALDQVAKYPPLADPEAFMRIHGATDEIVTSMMNGFENARKVAAH